MPCLHVPTNTTIQGFISVIFLSGKQYRTDFKIDTAFPKPVYNPGIILRLRSGQQQRLFYYLL